MNAYNYDGRGVIRNRAKAKQLRSFQGIRRGNITPTDIDGMMEYKNKAYIWIELKTSGAALTYGQALAYQRLTADLAQCGKCTAFFVATHETLNPDEDIDVKAALVCTLFLNGKEYDIQYQNKMLGPYIQEFFDLIDDGFQPLTPW